MKSKLLLPILAFSFCVISCNGKASHVVTLKCKTEKENAVMFIPYSMDKEIKVGEKLFVAFGEDGRDPYITNRPTTTVVIIDSIM